MTRKKSTATVGSVGADRGMPRLKLYGEGAPSASDVCMRIEQWIETIPQDRRPPVAGAIARAFLAFEKGDTGTGMLLLWNAMAAWSNSEHRRIEALAYERGQGEVKKARSLAAQIKKGGIPATRQAAEEAIERMDVRGESASRAYDETVRLYPNVSRNALAVAVNRERARRKR